MRGVYTHAHKSLSAYVRCEHCWNHYINPRRCRLIRKKVKKTILPLEQQELDILQQLTDLRIELLAPIPIKEVEAKLAELREKGLKI